MSEMQFDMLAIDDDEPITLLCKKALTGPHFRVQTAATVSEARELLAKNAFHIVVTDMQLPDGTGLEITELIKKEHPETEVIVLTGYAGMEVTINAMKLGAYAYLMKPLNVVALKATINHCVERRILHGRLESVKSCAESMAESIRECSQRLNHLPTGPRVAAAAEKQAYQALLESLTELVSRLRAVVRQS